MPLVHEPLHHRRAHAPGAEKPILHHRRLLHGEASASAAARRVKTDKERRYIAAHDRTQERSIPCLRLAAGAVGGASPARALTCPVAPGGAGELRPPSRHRQHAAQAALQKLAARPITAAAPSALPAPTSGRVGTPASASARRAASCRGIDSIAIDIVAMERPSTSSASGRRAPLVRHVLVHERKHQATDDAVLAEFARASSMRWRSPSLPCRTGAGALGEPRRRAGRFPNIVSARRRA